MGYATCPTDNARQDATARAVCGTPAEPYGILRHVFEVMDVGIVGTECLRTKDPARWAEVDALERKARRRGWEPDTG